MQYIFALTVRKRPARVIEIIIPWTGPYVSIVNGFYEDAYFS